MQISINNESLTYLRVLEVAELISLSVCNSFLIDSTFWFCLSKSRLIWTNLELFFLISFLLTKKLKSVKSEWKKQISHI